MTSRYAPGYAGHLRMSNEKLRDSKIFINVLKGVLLKRQSTKSWTKRKNKDARDVQGMQRITKECQKKTKEQQGMLRYAKEFMHF